MWLVVKAESQPRNQIRWKYGGPIPLTLKMLTDDASLKAIDADFVHLLTSWFNRGFLHLEKIDWESPATLLEKIMSYEAVQPMSGWSDLKRRLAEDRRCFAFFHPALPGEPLIFVEVALVRGMTSAVQTLIDAPEGTIDPGEADTAVFYAINNCQAGLVGISFGNFLIKQVVVELAHELPGLKTFATLSPILGFSAWLNSVVGKADDTLSGNEAEAIDHLSLASWHRNEEATEKMQGPLTRLCARYLLEVGSGGRPLDPVARFHLRNGARLERINWLGDVSAKGLSQSAGLMVNYLYDPRAIERNHEAYVKGGTITASVEIKRLIR